MSLAQFHRKCQLFPHSHRNECIYIYIYIYMSVCVCVCVLEVTPHKGILVRQKYI